MPRPAYTLVQKFLHWSVFLLVICAYLVTFGEDFYPHGSPERSTVWWLHISIGLLLLVFVAYRIMVRAFVGTPAMPDTMSPLEKTAAKSAHHLLYILLVLIPILGVWLAQLRGNELSFFGIFTIPQFLAPNRELSGTVKEVHGFLANFILIVAGIHALAALWHHFYKKDNVLKGMLP
ncbi:MULTISPECIES: cytochrome b [Brucella/Ochrobactrum group]|uniref:cytochrome b n=1 Tax=Brucella/Ochrobactrum group TaxID=2826938 RepID=UPI0011236870|nr:MULTISPECIES: cytochrome b [Brucella/Ochrobactrum group]